MNKIAFNIGYLLEKMKLNGLKHYQETGAKSLDQVNTRTSDFLENGYYNTTTKDGVN